MTKLIPEAMVHTDDLAWMPWGDERRMPFVAKGAVGEAWVKVLSRDPKSGAETLMYRLEPGWSAERIENAVYENLLVYEGELNVDGQTLRRYAYSYRPEGHVAASVSSPTGATIISYAGASGELSSPTPVPVVDTESMEWMRYPVPGDKYFIKLLRADEENLDTFFMMRTLMGHESQGVATHDAPEEGFILEGRNQSYDGPTQGRHIATRGTYIHRGPFSEHGFNKVLEDALIYKHDYFHGETEERLEIFLAAYPKETEAVRALREGRDPGLPDRW
jgi:hypothetical protein